MIKSLLIAPFAGYAPVLDAGLPEYLRNSKTNFEPGYLKLHLTGELKERGEKLWQIMEKGLMIRHLVMPNNVGGSKEVMDWIVGNLPKDTFVNIMSQYTPVYKAHDYPEIARRITRQEYEEAINHARSLGLTNLEVQGYYRF